MKRIILGAFLIALIPAVASAGTFNRNLSYGAVGTDVSNLQQFLADEGLYDGPISAHFGSITRSAVIAFQEKENIYPALGYFGPLTRADANAIAEQHPDWITTLSNSNYYSNVNGNSVKSPAYSSNGIPAGATAHCADGTYSFSLHHSGTCSHHGGVDEWLQ